MGLPDYTEQIRLVSRYTHGCARLPRTGQMRISLVQLAHSVPAHIRPRHFSGWCQCLRMAAMAGEAVDILHRRRDDSVRGALFCQCGYSRELAKSPASAGFFIDASTTTTTARRAVPTLPSPGGAVLSNRFGDKPLQPCSRLYGRAPARQGRARSHFASAIPKRTSKPLRGCHAPCRIAFCIHAAQE